MPISENTREIFALLSVIVSSTGFAIYAWETYRGLVRPHMIGWLIWTLLTAVVFFAQLWSGGGSGAWTTAAISMSCVACFIISWFRGDRSCTAFDWLCLGLTVLSVPLWVLSGTPLYSVILLTFIEFLGFAAMTPKAWRQPDSESPTYFLVSIIKYALGASALEVWSWQTAFYPVVTMIMGAAFALLIIARRNHLSLR